MAQRLCVTYQRALVCQLRHASTDIAKLAELTGTYVESVTSMSAKLLKSAHARFVGGSTGGSGGGGKDGDVDGVAGGEEEKEEKGQQSLAASADAGNMWLVWCLTRGSPIGSVNNLLELSSAMACFAAAGGSASSSTPPTPIAVHATQALGVVD